MKKLITKHFLNLKTLYGAIVTLLFNLYLFYALLLFYFFTLYLYLFIVTRDHLTLTLLSKLKIFLLITSITLTRKGLFTLAQLVCGYEMGTIPLHILLLALVKS